MVGNFIGTNAAGATNFGNMAGIIIDGGASNNTIGGGDSADRNVIDDYLVGVSISGSSTTDNVVAANFIGTNASNISLGGDEAW